MTNDAPLVPGRKRLETQFVGWAAVAVLSSYALFIGGAWLPTYDVSFRVVTLIVTAAGIAGWLIIAMRDPFWRPRTVLAPAFTAAFIAFVVSTLTSRYPRLGFEYLAWSTLLAALYLILQRLMASPFFRPRMVGFATVAGIVIGLVYIAAIVPRWIAWWGAVGRVAAPPLRPGFEGLVFGNPSAVMTASVLLAAPAVATLWGRSKIKSTLSAGIVLLTMTITLASGSRAGWLALAITGVAIGTVWLVPADRRRGLMLVARTRTARIAAVPLLITTVAVAIVVGPGLLARASAGGESTRTSFYMASLRMFESSPVAGTGPGTWAPLRIANTLAGEVDIYIPHAHQIYAQTLAEFGLLGLVAGLIVVFVLGRLLIGAIRDPDPLRRQMGWCTLFATVYFGAHQLLDFYANAPAILFAFAIPIAWLDASVRDTGSHPPQAPDLGRFNRPASRPVAIGGVVALIAAVGFLAWSESAALRMQAGTVLLNLHDSQDAVAPLMEAVANDPAMPPYRFALGLALANTGDLAGAERQFLSSANADELPEAWLNLAAVRAMLGDGAGAREALGRARRFGDQQPAVTLGAGAIALQLGDREDAISAFSQTLLVSPRLAGDPWWNANSERASAWREAYSMAFDRADPASQFELSLETGDLSTAHRILGEFDPDAATTYRLILGAWSGDAGMISDLAQRARDRPFDLTIVGWCARLARRNGDAESAEAYVVWAKTVGGIEGDGYETRVTEGVPDRLAGISSLYYGHFTYRRPTPWNQLVDVLPHLGYQ